MADLVAMFEVTEALNLGEDTSHDVELDLYIKAVTEHVEHRYGPLPSATLTEIVHAFTADDGVVRAIASRTPSTVTSMTHHDGRVMSSGFTIAADGYIEHASLTAGRWTLIYETSAAAVPADLKLAALEDIRGLYQPGQIGPPASFGAFGIESAETVAPYRPVRMWPRVDAWLNTHAGGIVA